MLSFTPAGNHPTIGTPSTVVTADFNNDGNLDLATCANASTGSISVLLGDGAGGFGDAQRTVIGSQLSSMAVADFNNDAKPDLVVSDYGGFRILVGNGDGTFQPDAPMMGGDMAAVGDFNNDSNIDVVVTWLDGDWASHYQVYRGNGQGGFAAGPDAYYWGWGGTAAVDLNNDGNLDLATGEGLAFLGDGNGSLQFDWEQPAPLSGAEAIATGDFTGDGNADAIVAGNTIAVLRGRGDGTFDAPITYPAAGTPHTAVATADFNADGKLDGEKVALTFVAPNHSNSMIMIQFPKQRAMMAVDFCPVGSLPYNDLLDFYYEGWMESLRWLDQQDFDTLEGGHYDLGAKQEVAVNIEYMQSLHGQVLNLIRAGQHWDHLWRNVKLDKFKDRIGYADMRVLNIQGMYRWVSNHRRGIW